MGTLLVFFIEIPAVPQGECTSENLMRRPSRNPGSRHLANLQHGTLNTPNGDISQPLRNSITIGRAGSRHTLQKVKYFIKLANWHELCDRTETKPMKLPMMLRITEHIESSTTARLRLDGTLSHETLDELTQAISRYRDHGGRIIMLDMAGVDFMNDQTACQLVKLCGNQIRLINCSPFITTLLGTITPGDAL